MVEVATIMVNGEPTDQPLTEATVIESLAKGGKYAQDIKEAFIKQIPEGLTKYNNIKSKFMKSEKTTSPLKQPQAKGGSIKKQYGYMGGGKVYPQPRTARKTV